MLHTSCRHQRHIDVPGTSNFRDIGGYHTADGNRVTMYKHFYRSDELSRVTADGAKMLRENLKIEFTIDLRSHEEAQQAPYSLEGIQRIPLPIRLDAFFDFIRTREELDESGAIGLLTRVAAPYFTLYKAEMRRFFDVLLTQVAGKPVVVHCTAGKDRTGMATALLLFALGVPERTIREDYLLTNAYVQPCTSACRVGKCRLTVEATNVLLRAQVEFFDSAVAGAKKAYGSLDSYLRKEMDLTPAKVEQLKSHYTRPSNRTA